MRCLYGCLSACLSVCLCVCGCKWECVCVCGSQATIKQNKTFMNTAASWQLASLPWYACPKRTPPSSSSLSMPLPLYSLPRLACQFYCIACPIMYMDMDMAIGIEPIIIIVVINTIHFYGQNGATAVWQTSRVHATCNMQMHFSPNIFVSVEFDSIIIVRFWFSRVAPMHFVAAFEVWLENR